MNKQKTPPEKSFIEFEQCLQIAIKNHDYDQMAGLEQVKHDFYDDNGNTVPSLQYAPLDEVLVAHDNWQQTEIERHYNKIRPIVLWEKIHIPKQPPELFKSSGDLSARKANITLADVETTFQEHLNAMKKKDIKKIGFNPIEVKTITDNS